MKMRFLDRWFRNSGGGAGSAYNSRDEGDSDLPNDDGIVVQINDKEATESPSDAPADGRANWGSQVEFLLSCLSFAVGLGNIWRFPYLCYRNGGGAFLIPYCLNIVLTGIPLFFFELAFGQFASQSPVAIWNVVPLFQGIGFAMFFISVGIGLYYNVIIAWTLYYFGATLSSLLDEQLPWVTCTNYWNTPACQELHNVPHNSSTHNSSYESAAQEYFSRHMLEISSGIDNPGNLRPELSLCLFIAWSIVFVALLKGVKSFGKAVYFTALFPYVILTILLIRGITLNGAWDGILFYINPDWSRLSDARVWADAAIQIFFSLGPCWGGLITLSSYNKFHNNCFRDAVFIACANCATSLYAGFVVFSFVGFMAYELDKDVKDVAETGPGLAFVIYPEAVSLLPGSHLWAILFFIMLLALGLGTQFSLLETVVSIIVDAWPRKWGRPNHILVLTCSCLTMFLGGLTMVTEGGMYVLQLMDNHAGTFSALITGAIEVGVVAWLYGIDRFIGDVNTMLQWEPSSVGYRIFRHYWHLMWRYVTPVICVIVLTATWITHEPMEYDAYIYPDWANQVGWVVSFTSVACIPLAMVVKLIMTPGTVTQRFSKLIRPTDIWGPRRPEHRVLAENKWAEDGHLSGGLANDVYVLGIPRRGEAIPMNVSGVALMDNMVE